MPLLGLLAGEIRSAVLLLVPLTAQYLLQALSRLTLVFVGNYDVGSSSSSRPSPSPSPSHIAVAAMGTMYSNVTGLSIGHGLSTAVSTLCAANFGRGCSEENGLVLRQCLRLQVLCFGVALAAAYYSKALLGFLKQPPELLEPIQAFALVQVLGLPARWVFNILLAILNSQKVTAAPVWLTTASSLTSLAAAWALVASGWGYMGVAWSFVIGAWVGLFATSAYIAATGRQSTVWLAPAPRSDGCAKRLSFKVYLHVAMPSFFSELIPWWAFEIFAIFAGMLGETAVAANGILQNTLLLAIFVYIAAKQATIVRLGHIVGSGDLSAVRAAMLAAVICSLSSSLCVSSLMLRFDFAMLRVYTADAEILLACKQASSVMILSIPCYALMSVFSAVLRVAGLQRRCALFTFASFYGFGLPAGSILGLVYGGGLRGLWFGILLSYCAAFLSQGVQSMCVDWEQAAKDVALYVARLPSASFDEDSAASGCSATPLLAASTPLLADPGGFEAFL